MTRPPDASTQILVDDLGDPAGPSLGDDAFHHLSRALRLRPGESVRAVDGLPLTRRKRPPRRRASAAIEAGGAGWRWSGAPMLPAPQQSTLAARGPAHQRTYEVAVIYRSEEIGRGEGRSKKAAGQAAAEVALERFSD